jgi:hypothetical protein
MTEFDLQDEDEDDDDEDEDDEDDDDEEDDDEEIETWQVCASPPATVLRCLTSTAETA